MSTSSDIRDTFFQECDDLLESLNDGLLQISSQNDADAVDPETINSIFRAVHSIKGGAAAFRLTALVEFAHVFENTLDALRAGRLAVTADLTNLLQRAADHLADHVRAARAGENLVSSVGPDLVGRLTATLVQEKAAEVPEEPALGFVPLTLSFDLDIGGGDPSPAIHQGSRLLKITFAPGAGFLDSGNDPVHLLREVAALGVLSAKTTFDRLPELSAMDPDDLVLDWEIELESEAQEDDIRQIFEFVSGLCQLEIRVVEDISVAAPSAEAEPATVETMPLPQNAIAEAPVAKTALPDRVPNPAAPQTAPSAAASSAPRASLRVDTDHVDRLINLAGELVINQSVLSRSIVEAGLTSQPALAAALSDLRNLSREIQEGVMSIRAQPVKPMFQRMARIVRDASDLAGKRVEFITLGEGTEVDKTVIEQLVDPLTHMIRNAIDHGLETPEARLEAGKPETGQVRLFAAHRSGRVVIEVSDDGGGINRPKVLNIARSKGLIDPDAVLSDSDIDALLFLPGFSTASSVTSLSGRGVGLDVVKSAIRKLGGRLTVSSTPGQGTTMSISLPLTLAVLDGMVIEVAGETMVVPIAAIAQTLQPAPDEIDYLGAQGSGAGGIIVRLRDRYIPVVDLGNLLGFREGAITPDKMVLLIVETDTGATCALAVDSIHDQQQVVIKGLEANYGRVPFVAAATILGNGRIALILDPEDIISFDPRAKSAAFNQKDNTP